MSSREVIRHSRPKPARARSFLIEALGFDHGT
jgi:hypothetical protein